MSNPHPKNETFVIVLVVVFLAVAGISVWSLLPARFRTAQSLPLAIAPAIGTLAGYLAEREKRKRVSLPDESPVGAEVTDAIDRLNQLTHDPEVSQRLLSQAQRENPHRDRRWCIEKVIEDLERDRR